jgi:threonine dehydrogenase-like Zn-dependent dehydrogenase
LFVRSYSKPEVYGIVEVPLPKLRDNDVLIKVKACGVCGTDLHIHEGEFIAKVWEASYISRDVVEALYFCGGLGTVSVPGWLPPPG